MILEDGDLLCPYCGSVDTEQREARADDSVYECRECVRTFSAPQID
jgi:DNA-directed RNA polymerase subunit RPC12/RpoP